jgi:hypothetical protein
MLTLVNDNIVFFEHGLLPGWGHPLFQPCLLGSRKYVFGIQLVSVYQVTPHEFRFLGLVRSRQRM